MTLLLASVTGPEEAELALDRGADIIDLKNPAAGALGALATETVRACLSVVGGRRPVSAVAGDLPMQPDVIVAAVEALARTGVDYVKVGLFPAARRAARYGDGFLPGVADDEKLRWLLGIMREECARIGRRPETIEVSAGRAGPNLDGVKRLEDLGVARFIVPPPGFDPESITQGLETLSDRVISRL